MLDLPTEWDEAAAQRAAALRISTNDLFEGRDLVRSALGVEWLSKEQAKLDRPGGSITNAHPLFRQLTSPNDLALIEVCELGHYLRHFMNDPRIGEIVKALRGPKFLPTLFELAMAYRWKDAGALVTLEPATARGYADFAATIEATRFIIEVSRFEDDFISGPQFKVPHGIAETALANTRDDQLFVLKIRGSGAVSRQVETLIRSQVKATCKAFNRCVESGRKHYVSESDLGTIEIEALTADSEDNPFAFDDFGRIVSLREHEWNGFMRLPGAAGDERARIFISFAPDERSVLGEIVAKAEKEAQQLSGTEGPSVVMLDVTSFAEDIEQLNLGTAVEDFEHILRNHRRLTSLWFFTRQWTTAYRFKYQFTFLESPYSSDHVPSTFVTRFIEREWRWDFLGASEYDITTPEDAMRSYAERMPGR